MQAPPGSLRRAGSVWLQSISVADTVGQLPYRNGCREELVIAVWLISGSGVLQVFFLHMQILYIYFFFGSFCSETYK